MVRLKVRDENWDVVKGLGILLVIMGHSNLPATIYYGIYAFHMPLFFIVSGIFFSDRKTVWGGKR